MQAGDLTLDIAKRTMPKHLKHIITQDLLDKINGMHTDITLAEDFRSNIIGYSSVLKDGRFKMEQYIYAVKYVGHKVLGDTSISAYAKTHPKRYNRMLQEGKNDKHMASIISTYNGSKLITLLLDQAVIPIHLLNRDKFQQAINVQADLMLHAKSEKVRSDAAACLIKELKPPEKIQIEMEISSKGDPALEALSRTTMELVAQQKLMLQSGAATAKEIAGTIIDIEPESEIEQ